MVDKIALDRLHMLFNSCSPLFIALGDEVRQKLILDIVDAGEAGINVTNLSAKSKLSRPAISHHLKVLKDCSLIRPLKEGTQIFYQINLASRSLHDVSELATSIQHMMKEVELQRGNAVNAQS